MQQDQKRPSPAEVQTEMEKILKEQLERVENPAKRALIPQETSRSRMRQKTK